jgi:S-adenosyl methyltransferase
MMLGILGPISDSDDPEAIVSKLRDALPSGSCIAISDGVSISETFNQAVRDSGWYHARSPEQITGVVWCR